MFINYACFVSNFFFFVSRPFHYHRAKMDTFGNVFIYNCQRDDRFLQFVEHQAFLAADIVEVLVP